MSILSNELIAFALIGIIIFFIVYINADKTINWLHKNSLGQREEIIRLLDLMFVDTDKKKITISMLLASFGMGSLIFIAFWPKISLGIFFALVVTVMGFIIPRYVITALYEKRCNRFVDQMVDGMTIMSNGVTSGLSVPQSMERIVNNLGNPIAQEFNLVLSQIRLGKSVEEALTDLAERIPRPDLQMFVTSVNILKETGGNMSETFQTINNTIRERQKLEKKIQALTAQGIAQGVIITLVPFFLLLVMYLIQPDYISPMFNTTLGIVFLFIMLCLQVIGAIAIKKIVTINV